MKRTFDILFSIIGLLVFAIPLAVLYILIKTREHHPFLFRQTRLGKKKRPFEMLKIQTMVDGQVTPIGRIIRSTGLDEVPQFINVLRGQMSIVGPRALTDSVVMAMKWDDAYHARRWAVRPGITGFAQLYAKEQSNASFFLDCKYIECSNVCLDFCLLCITFLINIFGKNRIIKLLFNREIIEKT